MNNNNMKYIKLFEQFELINEFKADLMKQCIVLMGLPAAGKSTFVNNNITKYVPGFKNFKVVNSDIQVLRFQKETSNIHFTELYDLYKENNEEGFLNMLDSFSYTSNDGKQIKHPMYWEWFLENDKVLAKKGSKLFWKYCYKKFYAIYFDIRSLAKKTTNELFPEKK